MMKCYEEITIYPFPLHIDHISKFPPCGECFRGWFISFGA